MNHAFFNQLTDHRFSTSVLYHFVIIPVWILYWKSCHEIFTNLKFIKLIKKKTFSFNTHVFFSKCDYNEMYCFSVFLQSFKDLFSSWIKVTFAIIVLAWSALTNCKQKAYEIPLKTLGDIKYVKRLPQFNNMGLQIHNIV